MVRLFVGLDRFLRGIPARPATPHYHTLLVFLAIVCGLGLFGTSGVIFWNL